MTETITRTAATVATSALLTAATHASSAILKKPTLPELTGLRLHVEAGRLHITGYDFELRITRRVPINGSLGDVVVDAATLKQAVKNLDQKAPVELAVTATEGDLVLTQGKRVITLSGMDASNLPDLPDPITERTFTMRGAQVKFLADKVLPFAGRDDMLPVLNGTVQIDVEDGTLTAGSTDRFRAALAEQPVNTTDGDFHFLLPDLARFAPVFDDPDQMVLVGVANNQPAVGGWVTLLTEDATVTVRTVDGSFPKLRALFPSEHNLFTDLDPVTFGKALKFVSLAIGKNEAVRVEVDNGHATLTGKSDGPKPVTMTDSVPVDVHGRDADLGITTGFNPTFLADVLKVFGKDRVTMANTAAAKPALFTSDCVPGLRVLLMPRRLVDEEKAA